jgi:hypothetical protein
MRHRRITMILQIGVQAALHWNDSTAQQVLWQRLAAFIPQSEDPEDTKYLAEVENRIALWYV